MVKQLARAVTFYVAYKLDRCEPSQRVFEGIIWYKTTDGGINWTSKISTYESIAAKQPSVGRNRVSFSIFYDLNTLWILDNALGELYRSTDGGEKWQFLGSSPSFQNVQERHGPIQDGAV